MKVGDKVIFDIQKARKENYIIIKKKELLNKVFIITKVIKGQQDHDWLQFNNDEGIEYRGDMFCIAIKEVRKDKLNKLNKI